MNDSATKTGNIKFFDETKKYGFIIAENGAEIFFHVSGVAEGSPVNRFSKDKPCTYTLFEGRKGPEAENVTITGRS